MYLSRIDMSLSAPNVRAALRDSQWMHRLATGLYGVGRAEAQLLYRCRVQGSKVSLYLYSAVPVDKTRIPGGMSLYGERDMSGWLADLADGQCFHFDLLTMPFKKLPVGEGKNSRRRVFRLREERLAWLERKAAQNGFIILQAEETAGEKSRAVHPRENGGELYLDTYQYTGILRITDADRFRNAVQKGIGTGKSYGLGMLLLKG